MISPKRDKEKRSITESINKHYFHGPFHKNAYKIILLLKVEVSWSLFGSLKRETINYRNSRGCKIARGQSLKFEKTGSVMLIVSMAGLSIFFRT